MATAVATRAELRLRAAREIGDGLEVLTTAAGNTGGTTLIDTLNLMQPNDALIGAQIVSISSGAHQGEVRYISDNVQSTGTVTVGTAFTGQVAAARVFHVFNLRDIGVPVNDMNGFLDEAIDAVRDTALVEVLSSALAFDRASPVITLSNATLGGAFTDGTLWGILGVAWQDSSDIWHETDDFRVDKASRTIELRGRGRDYANGRNIRIRGCSQPSLLTSDTSTTGIDPIYIVKYAAARALFSISGRLGPEKQALAKYMDLKDAAERRKLAVRTRFVPGPIKL